MIELPAAHMRVSSSILLEAAGPTPRRARGHPVGLAPEQPRRAGGFQRRLIDFRDRHLPARPGGGRARATPPATGSLGAIATTRRPRRADIGRRAKPTAERLRAPSSRQVVASQRTVATPRATRVAILPADVWLVLGACRTPRVPGSHGLLAWHRGRPCSGGRCAGPRSTHLSASPRRPPSAAESGRPATTSI